MHKPSRFVGIVVKVREKYGQNDQASPMICASFWVHFKALLRCSVTSVLASGQRGEGDMTHTEVIH